MKKGMLACLFSLIMMFGSLTALAGNLEKNSINLTTDIVIGYGPHTATRFRHHGAWFSEKVGWIMTDTLATGRLCQGNLEAVLDLFGGLQFNPNYRYFSGGTLLLRYNLDTKGRLIPFLDAGAGLSLTNIGRPDISDENTYFNFQGGIGLKYF